VIIEFVITESSSAVLTIIEDPHSYLKLVRTQRITDSGITVVLENVFEYDLRVHLYVGSIIHDGSRLPEDEDYFWSESDTWEWKVLPADSSTELALDWTLSYGILPPGQYDLIIIAVGNAPPPHPTGGFQEVFEISITI